MNANQFKIGDKVIRSKSISALFGSEFNGGKEIEEIVKIDPDANDPDHETKLWLSNGYWVNPKMVQKIEEEN